MAGRQIVRRPLRVREGAGRTIDQRLLLRFPWLSALVTRLVAARPPRSRLRQALLKRTVRLGIEAYNRRDLDVVVLVFDPAVEYYPYREFVEAALTEPVYRGPTGYRAYIESTYDVWGRDVRLYPTELIDLGDQFVILADMPMRAQASGVALSEKYACVVTLKDGRAIRWQDFLRQEDALEAVGLTTRGVETTPVR